MTKYGYSNEFGMDKNKKTELTPEEKKEKEIKLLLGELMHAEKVLTRSGGAESRAINRQLSEMPDDEIKEIIAGLSLEEAKQLQAHMNQACIAGQTQRFKDFLDERLANC